MSDFKYFLGSIWQTCNYHKVILIIGSYCPPLLEEKQETCPPSTTVRTLLVFNRVLGMDGGSTTCHVGLLTLYLIRLPTPTSSCSNFVPLSLNMASLILCGIRLAAHFFTWLTRWTQRWCRRRRRNRGRRLTSFIRGGTDGRRREKNSGRGRVDGRTRYSSR